MSLLNLAAEASQVIEWKSLGLAKGINLGPFELRFYSLAYLAGVMTAYFHTLKMIKLPGSPLAQRHCDDLFLYCFLGVIFGGRLGYAMFYDPSLFWTFEGDGFVTYRLLRLWDGGMSFHGGVLGVLVAIAYECRRVKLEFLRICDYISVGVPFGMLFGRLANFVNGELYGRVTDVAWAMSFPENIGGAIIDGPPRHPSQLYQAGLEGFVMMVIMLLLFWKTRMRHRPGFLVATFAAGMGIARFINEFFRQPDAHLMWVYEDTGLSMGQWLSVPLILTGVLIMIWAYKKGQAGGDESAKDA